MQLKYKFRFMSHRVPKGSEELLSWPGTQSCLTPNNVQRARRCSLSDSQSYALHTLRPDYPAQSPSSLGTCHPPVPDPQPGACHPSAQAKIVCMSSLQKALAASWAPFFCWRCWGTVCAIAAFDPGSASQGFFAPTLLTRWSAEFLMPVSCAQHGV